MNEPRERPDEDAANSQGNRYRNQVTDLGLSASSQPLQAPDSESSTTSGMDFTTLLAQRLVPLDLTFNVQKRLADLQRWDREWQREHDQLDQISRRLEYDRHIDQLRAEQIEGLQRRIFLQRTRVALEITQATKKREYTEKLRTHLVQQYAALSQREKDLWLNNLFFIMTPVLRALCTKIEQIHHYRAYGQQRNFLLAAKTGMGKTTFLDWWLANAFPARVLAQYNHVPIIKIDAPLNENSPKFLLQRIIMECGLNWLKGDDEETLLRKLIMCFQKCQVELLIVDEVEHITSHRIRRRLVEISNRTRGIPIICASCNPHRWVEGDPEIAGRWNDYVELQPYTGQRLSALLAFIEFLLPFPEPSYLAYYTRQVDEVDKSSGETVKKDIAGLAQLIEDWTQGVLKNIMLLILEASRQAIAQNQACLTAKILDATWRDIKWTV
jgi:hypothetical protein